MAIDAPGLVIPNLTWATVALSTAVNYDGIRKSRDMGGWALGMAGGDWGEG